MVSAQIRDLALDYLGFLEVRFALYKPVLPLLRRMFEQTGTLNVVDLCSGRGELVLALYEALASEGINVEFTLTDKFPNLSAFRYISSQHPLNLHYISGSVDATKVPPELVGLRTIFNAFHHFSPRAARSCAGRRRQSGATDLHFRNPGTQVAHDHFPAAYAAVCDLCNAVHKTVPMEAIAMDLLDSAGPFHVLLGRRDLSTSGLHDSRAIGTYPRTRRLRMECRKHVHSWTTRTSDVLARSDTL